MQKVIFYSDSCGYGGAEKVLEGIIKHFSDRFEVYFICSAPSIYKLGGHRKIRIIRNRIRHQLDLINIIALKNEIIGINPDIIFLNFFAPSSCVYMSLISFMYLKHSRTIGLIHSVARAKSKYPMVAMIRKHIVSFIINRINQLIFPSHSSLQRFRDNYPINSNNINIIHNGFDEAMDLSEEKKEEIKIKYELQNEIILGVISRLVREKGIGTLLEAFKLVLAKLKNIKLLVVGDGQMRSIYEKRAKDLNIDNNIIFIGFVDDPMQYISICDVIIMPSEYEVFPLALGESMSMCKPVIATNVGGVPELAGDAAILIPPNNAAIMSDAIVELLADNVKMNGLGQRAGKRIKENFAKKKMYSKYEKLFNNTKGDTKA